MADAWFAALRETPDDQALRAAFSDWLLENDYPLSAAVFAGTPRESFGPHPQDFWAVGRCRRFYIAGLWPIDPELYVWPHGSQGFPVSICFAVSGSPPLRTLRTLLASVPDPGPNERPC